MTIFTVLYVGWYPSINSHEGLNILFVLNRDCLILLAQGATIELLAIQRRL